MEAVPPAEVRRASASLPMPEPVPPNPAPNLNGQLGSGGCATASGRGAQIRRLRNGGRPRARIRPPRNGGRPGSLDPAVRGPVGRIRRRAAREP